MKQKMPLASAVNIAVRFKKVIDPYCSKVVIAGSVRRMKPQVGDIEVVCQPTEPDSLDKFFAKGYPGLKINGHRLKRLVYPISGVQIEMYIPEPYDFGRILAIRTGSSVFSHSCLAVQWNRLGWGGTTDGLRRKAECIHKGNTWKIKPEFKDNPTLPPVFENEEVFFAFLNLTWIPPERRSWTSANQKISYAT